MADRELEIAEQTAIRHRLLANGYTPLANKDKMCILKEWSTLTVTDDLIEAWSDMYKYRATGVRLDNGLVMIDFDINDVSSMSAIIEQMPQDLWDVFMSCPVRHGKGAKEAWFARTETPFTRWCSAGFIHPDTDPNDDGAVVHRLEVFGGASSRQAGAYGAHTIGADGEVKIAYHWAEERGLEEVPLDELPLVTEQDVERLCIWVNETLARLGWVIQQKLKAGKTTEKEVFDLTDDMVFETVDGATDLAGLTAMVSQGSVRLSASWLEGPSARNMTRCIATARPDGTVQILETADYQMHRPVRRDLQANPAMVRLAALMASRDTTGTFFEPSPRTPQGRAEQAAVVADVSDAREEIVAHLIEKYAAYPADARTPVYPLDGTAPLSMAGFKLRYAPYMIVEEGPRGGMTSTNPVDLWRIDPERIEIAGNHYRPDSRELLVFDPIAGGLVLNSYRAPVHDAAPQGIELWHAFLEHLLPDAWERAWLVNKLAGKVQRPWLPGVATLMVATRQGTGRGTLFQILEGLFGQHNCVTLERTKLFGSDGQGQYNDWRAGRLAGFVHELLAGESSAGFHHRRLEMYEHLKIMAEPESQTFDVIEKFKGSRSAQAYISLFMATNHANALPIQRDDRRIAVLTCGDAKLDEVPELDAIHMLKRDPGFLAAVYEELALVTVDWTKVMHSPMTAGREAMIEENMGDLDTVIISVLDEVPGDFITMGALRQRVNQRLRAEGLDSEVKWQGRLSNLLAMPHNTTGWFFSRHRYKVAKPGAVDVENDHIKIAVVARKVAGTSSARLPHAAFDNASIRERRELLKAEDPNARASKALQALQERGLHVVPGKGKDE